MSRLTAPADAGEAAPRARRAIDPPDLADLAALPDEAAVDVRPVARMLCCSVRHIWRMVDSGAMPRPLELGRLRRWRLGTLRDWLRQGAKPVRKDTHNDASRGGATRPAR